jgi:hypothetical protein
VKNAESAEGVFAASSPAELKPMVALGVAVELLGLTVKVVDADKDGETEGAIDEVEEDVKAVEVGPVPEVDDVHKVLVVPCTDFVVAEVDEDLEVSDLDVVLAVVVVVAAGQ